MAIGKRLDRKVHSYYKENALFLAKTGKTSLETIDQETLKKLELCYVEITREKRTEATAQIKKYIECNIGKYFKYTR